MAKGFAKRRKIQADYCPVAPHVSRANTSSTSLRGGSFRHPIMLPPPRRQGNIRDDVDMEIERRVLSFTLCTAAIKIMLLKAFAPQLYTWALQKRL